MEREIFEDTIRLMVATGSGIDSSLVAPGFTNAHAPKSGMFAAVTMISQRVQGLNPHYYYVGNSESFVVDSVYTETKFGVDWFRDGAIDAAINFRDWVRSETGKNWAATANVDGRIRAFNVYDGGSGYQNGARVFVRHGSQEDSEALEAQGTIEASGGVIHRILLDQHGKGYKDIPRMDGLQAFPPEYGYGHFPYMEITPGHNADGRQAGISALGFGLSVKDLARMDIFRIDESVDGANYEERVHMTLNVCHCYLREDTTSGRIEQAIEDPPGLAFE